MPIEELMYGFLAWCVSHSPALGYMEVVPRCDAATLLPIMHSDEWEAYNQVQHFPNVSQHSTVNHSISFINPIYGTHTQNIESYWNRVKNKFKRMKGVHEDMLTSYLDKFMWRECHGKKYNMAMQNLCRDIALRYPV